MSDITFKIIFILDKKVIIHISTVISLPCCGGSDQSMGGGTIRKSAFGEKEAAQCVCVCVCVCVCACVSVCVARTSPLHNATSLLSLYAACSQFLLFVPEPAAVSVSGASLSAAALGTRRLSRDEPTPDFSLRETAWKPKDISQLTNNFRTVFWGGEWRHLTAARNAPSARWLKSFPTVKATGMWNKNLSQRWVLQCGRVRVCVCVFACVLDCVQLN